MRADERMEQISQLVTERGFASVKELSLLLDVSEVTIRRDLKRLHDGNRLRRTHGGATARQKSSESLLGMQHVKPARAYLEGFFVFERVDVLIATSVDPQTDRVLLDRMQQREIPIVTESIGMKGMKTLVAVDNYQASQALGRWAGNYTLEHFEGRANILDLTYQLSNTQERSQGFIDGLREILPSAETALSINVQSLSSSAYQRTIDALQVFPTINIIFAINDASAWGALEACQDLGIDPDSLLVLPFGLEGDTLKNALIAGDYCKAGVAMFPEIVGPVCVEAALNAYANRPMPPHLVTPYAVLTSETLTEFYTHDEMGWHIRWDTVKEQLTIPLDVRQPARKKSGSLPRRIGFVVPFFEHEWYKNLIASMRAHIEDMSIELDVVDVDQNLKDEVTMRRRGIAEMAAKQARPGDVLLIGGGQISAFLAEELVAKENITVITNSIHVFDILREAPHLTLISTGGLFRSAGNTLIGPPGEGALRELRADKLFLEVAGVSLDFGLSDTHVAEVTMKQAMINAAREVVLLADHTRFGQESVIQVSPANIVDKLITDNALPASIRLDLAALGIEVIIAKV